MSYYVSQAKRKDDIVICEASTRGVCTQQCAHLHHAFNYIWQLYHTDMDWLTVKEGRDLEQAFHKPENIHHVVQTELLGSDGSVLVKAQVLINFNKLAAEINSTDGQLVNVHAPVRRLSTLSYMQLREEAVCPNHTLWSWYWQDGDRWKVIGVDSPTPMQCVLEAKYLGGQEVYRFEVDTPNSPFPLVFLLNFNDMILTCVNNQHRWNVTRRPVLGGVPHPRKPLPYPIDLPDNWTPVDVQHDYELVPLNPKSLEHHLVASEFVSSLPSGRTILDVYRLQNPYLWSKYQGKKLYLQSKNKPSTELQLFHGTSDETAVQAIFRQNFDWRMAGKNATMLGKGSYFAINASYSDNFTGPTYGATHKKWMFMARVMVGRYTNGSSHLSRPPPLDPRKPHGDLYDSCVDHVNSPNIYVVFDNEQCYPEYVICYKQG